MDQNEQQLIKLLDLMDAKQIEKALSVMDGAIVMPAASVAKIKQQAFGKVKLKRKSKTNKLLAFKLTAASILLLVFAVAFYGPANTWAQIVKAFNFIPGIGKVVDNNKEITRHVLAQPIELEFAESALTVKAISVDERNLMVVVEEVGDNLTLPAEEAILILGEQEYVLRRKSLSYQRRKEDESGDWYVLDWEGYFMRYGLVTTAARDGLVRVYYGEGKQLEIPFKLEKAANFNDYAELGPTAATKEISITAVPSLEDNLLKISLLSPPLAGQQVRSYAYTLDTLMTLSDHRGNTYALAAEHDYSLPTNEVMFDVSEAEAKQFILSIPCIVIKQEKAAALKLPIPQQGKALVDQIVKLADYEIAMHTIERLDEKTIQLHVTLPQAELARAHSKDHLVDFDLKDNFNFGVEMHGDDTGRYYKIGIPKDAEEISLTLTEPQLAIYGPWQIELDLDN